ncbi:MAG: hypothetical protein VB876_12445 [Pirellulales bacterium]
MEKIQLQVRQARRRMNLQKFLDCLPWCLLVPLAAALVAIAVHKWFPTGSEPWIWNTWWMGGGIVLGIVAAAVWMLTRPHEQLEAAIELDRRFGLKERVSSSLSLSEIERKTEAGRAVVKDAERRVERVDVSERFGVFLGRPSLLPLIPAALTLLVIFALSQNEVVKSARADTDEQQKVRNQVKRSTDELRKKIEKRRKELAEKGLKEADDSLRELSEGLKDLDKKTSGDRKKSMIKLNNLADRLRQKRDKLGGAEELKKQLNKMKNLEKGPADELAKAMKNGKFKDALQELEKLKQEFERQELTDEDREKLAEQLEKMKDKMEDVANAHNRAMENLEQQIKDARESGDIDKADQLQRALDKLQQQMPQMDQLGDLASKLGQISEAAKNGDQQAMQNALNDLQTDLENLQNELDELESLDSGLDAIAEAKDSMNCDQCKGGD